MKKPRPWKRLPTYVRAVTLADLDWRAGMFSEGAYGNLTMAEGLAAAAAELRRATARRKRR